MIFNFLNGKTIKSIEAYGGYFDEDNNNIKSYGFKIKFTDGSEVVIDTLENEEIMMMSDSLEFDKF